MAKNRIFAGLLCVLLLLMQLTALPGHADTVSEELIGGIVQYQLGTSGAATVQDWINGSLTANAGISSEFYIIALSQSGESYDYTAYADALGRYAAQDEYAGAVSRQKYALTMLAAGRNDGYIRDVMESTIGAQGIMSLVFGLHLLNNGCTSTGYTAQSVCDAILSVQLPDGGWALFGGTGDTDVTAMVLQALAPYAGTDAQPAIDRAVQLLSQQQLDDGGFMSMGVENPESTAQVVTALSALGIDSMSDARFVKNGHTMADALMQFRLPDGSFCHAPGGGYNHLATMQVYYAMIAYRRMQQGRGSLYLLDAPAQPEPETLPPAEPQQPVQPQEPAQTDAAAAAEPQPVIQIGEQPQSTAPEESTQTEQTTDTQTTETVQTTASQTALTTAAATQSAPASEPETQTTAETTTQAAASPAPSGGGYKPWAVLGVAGAGCIGCAVCILLRRRHPKNFLAIALITGAGIAFVLLTDFRRPEEFYTAPVKENAVGTVTMTIRCDTVLGRSDADYIPADGVILPETELALAEGDTVFDLLSDAVRTGGIQMEYRGSGEMTYIAGIGYLYELQFGDLSGWMYFVNGASPSVGCGAYTPEDGDVIEWLYTCSIGNDLKGESAS